MKKLVLLSFVTFFFGFNAGAVPIETPDFDERNEFAIKSPLGWGYRTFSGKNGLIGVLWPSGTSFNSTDTAVFVFLQDSEMELPEIPDNINLFTEKCPKADFKFANPGDDGNKTLSIAERYFKGRCGRTMVLLKETVQNYAVVVAFASAKYVTKKQLADVKEVVASYKKEIEKYLEERQTRNLDENESKKNDNQGPISQANVSSRAQLTSAAMATEEETE